MMNIHNTKISYHHPNTVEVDSISAQNNDQNRAEMDSAPTDKTDKYDPNIHHRKSIRLTGYDYAQAGLYFITICCQNRECLLGNIIDGKMVFNDAGKMVNQTWNEIPIYYNGFNIHQFVAMPNHIHGIIEIVGAGPRACPNEGWRHPHNRQSGQPQGVAPTGLGDIVGRYKALTTQKYIDGVKQNGWQQFDGKLWQRNYWEHIIRNENEYQHITQYIIDNPKKWNLDKLNNGNGNKVMESQTQYTVGADQRICLENKAWMV